MPDFDLATSEVRDLNQALHELKPDTNETHWKVLNPQGKHALAVGLNLPVTVEIDGHVGYYCAGMNKEATVVVTGNAGVGIAENMMSGEVRVKGDASQAAGATAHGGLLAFMAQAGNLVVLGDAGEALGDSIYEARLFVRGEVASLGADCVKKEMEAEDVAALQAVLFRAGLGSEVRPDEFTLYGSGRTLYHFQAENSSSY